MRRRICILMIMLGVIFMIHCQNHEIIDDYAPINHVQIQIQKFAPVEIDYDKSLLSENEQKALVAMVKAAQYMDKLFLKQVYHKNEKIQAALQREKGSGYPE